MKNENTSKWTNKAHDDLEKIIAKHSFDSYKQANYKNGKKITKRHIPYSLNDECIEALRLKQILLNDTITKEQEEEIKYFLLIYRTSRREFLES